MAHEPANPVHLVIGETLSVFHTSPTAKNDYNVKVANLHFPNGKSVTFSILKSVLSN